MTRSATGISNGVSSNRTSDSLRISYFRGMAAHVVILSGSSHSGDARQTQFYIGESKPSPIRVDFGRNFSIETIRKPVLSTLPGLRKAAVAGIPIPLPLRKPHTAATLAVNQSRTSMEDSASSSSCSNCRVSFLRRSISSVNLAHLHLGSDSNPWFNCGDFCPGHIANEESGPCSLTGYGELMSKDNIGGVPQTI